MDNESRLEARRRRLRAVAAEEVADFELAMSECVTDASDVEDVLEDMATEVFEEVQLEPEKFLVDSLPVAHEGDSQPSRKRSRSSPTLERELDAARLQQSLAHVPLTAWPLRSKVSQRERRQHRAELSEEVETQAASPAVLVDKASEEPAIKREPSDGAENSDAELQLLKTSTTEAQGPAVLERWVSRWVLPALARWWSWPWRADQAKVPARKAEDQSVLAVGQSEAEAAAGGRSDAKAVDTQSSVEGSKLGSNGGHDSQSEVNCEKDAKSRDAAVNDTIKQKDVSKSGVAAFEKLRQGFLNRHGNDIVHKLTDCFGGKVRLHPAPLSTAVMERFEEAHRTKKDCTMIPTVHGTKAENHRAIFERGLLVPGSSGVQVRCGLCHGSGIYTSHMGASWLSHSFCTEPRMLVCAVLDDSKKVNPWQLGNFMVTRESGTIRYVGDAIVVFNASHVVPLFEAVADVEDFKPRPQMLARWNPPGVTGAPAAPPPAFMPPAAPLLPRHVLTVHAGGEYEDPGGFIRKKKKRVKNGPVKIFGFISDDRSDLVLHYRRRAARKRRV